MLNNLHYLPELLQVSAAGFLPVVGELNYLLRTSKLTRLEATTQDLLIIFIQVYVTVNLVSPELMFRRAIVVLCSNCVILQNVNDV